MSQSPWIAGPLNASKAMDWRTPPDVLDLVRQCYETVEIGLDPATSDDNPTRALEWTSSTGLDISWRGHGLVWLNPPYGRGLRRWTRKARQEFEHAGAADADALVMLVPARTDTAWWHEDVLPLASAILFLRGRLTFVGAAAPAPFPSALVFRGGLRWDVVERSRERGWLVYP